MKLQKTPEKRSAKKQKGLVMFSGHTHKAIPVSYLFQNCGNKIMPGIKTKAGKVILLKVPKTSKKAKTKLEAREAFCKRVSRC
jgi:hypothetical protein